MGSFAASCHSLIHVPDGILPLWGKSAQAGRGMAGRGMGQGRKLAFLASSSCMALLMGSGSAFAGSCYTGPFPVNNVVAQTCITATNTTFSGNITNSATITAGPTAPTNNGITVDNSAITGAVINQGVISAPSG